VARSTLIASFIDSFLSFHQPSFILQPVQFILLQPAGGGRLSLFSQLTHHSTLSASTWSWLGATHRCCSQTSFFLRPGFISSFLPFNLARSLDPFFPPTWLDYHQFSKLSSFFPLTRRSSVRSINQSTWISSINLATPFPF
jgi:hypothetical protein